MSMTPDQKEFYAAAVGGILAPHAMSRSVVRGMLVKMGLSGDDDDVIAYTIARGWAEELRIFGERYLCAAPGPPPPAS
jgi:hypothetical protein